MNEREERGRREREEREREERETSSFTLMYKTSQKCICLVETM